MFTLKRISLFALCLYPTALIANDWYYSGGSTSDATAASSALGAATADGGSGDAAPCDACGDACDGCCSCCDRLFGIIAPSEPCFDEFVSPISNPLFFEDPRTLTEARFHFVHQNIPGSQPVLRGGDAQYYALQIRAAVNDNLSIIATKDGYIDLHAGNPAVGERDGWADVAIGFKYNLVRNVQEQTILSTGLTYEADLGTHSVFQGRGDGEFHLFLTGGKEILEDTHWVSGTGFRLPTDFNARSQMWYWSNHIDRKIWRRLYAVYEVNWFHWMGDGDGSSFGTSGFEGNDLFNLGSSGVAGNDLATMAVGASAKPRDNVEVGVGYEFPVTPLNDLLKDRLYVTFMWRY